MSHVPLPVAGSVISLVAGLMFGIAAFVGAHQMSKNDKDIWVSLGKSLFLFLEALYTQFIKMNKDHK